MNTKYKGKPLRKADETRDKYERIWKAFCDNVDSNPTYASFANRFNCNAGLIRIALSKMCTQENLEKLDKSTAEKVVALILKKRTVHKNSLLNKKEKG